MVPIVVTDSSAAIPDSEEHMRRLMAVSFCGIAMLALSFAAFADEGTAKSVTGTPEDSFCYITMGASGASHKKCAMGCAKKGIPVSLIEKGTGATYILLPPKNAEALPDSLISKMEDQVTVTGKEFSKNGVNYLTVESVK
jgi:hypothetical protein